jgi:protein gp37
MAKTSIGWTDHSINPLRARHRITGKGGHVCEKISPGCNNCYSSGMQPRLFGTPEFSTPEAKDMEPFLERKALAEVRRRRKPTKYFWGDMTDMFGAWWKQEWIDACFATMAATPQHIHQILTKRPERILSCLPPDWGSGYPNVWLGVSVENRRWLTRLDVLAAVPAVVRFASFEPLLGDLGDLSPWLPSLEWAIVGGESGRKRRPMEVRWLLDVVAQCQAAGVPVFVKQDTALLPGQQGRIPADVWALKQLPQGM